MPELCPGIPLWVLEYPASGENQLVIVGVKLAGGNLHAAAEGQPGSGLLVPRMQCQFTEEDARRDELLNLAVVRAAFVESRVALELRPEDFVELPLRSRVPYNRSAGSVGGGIAGGQSCADGGLHIDVAESLAEAQIGLHAGVGRSILRLAGGHCGQRPESE